MRVVERRAPEIRVLSDAFAARIAAGEVIERPASVVKELVENSLDAGATRIEVRVEDGGRRAITVVDDGHGIPPDQIELAFQRFATSKIDEASELIGIPTLGFRGEALPSIASVSVVEMSSRAAERETGARLSLEYGRVVDRKAAGLPRGTTVSVRGLFSNVPARQRFLSSAGGELTRIVAVVTSYALTRPHVGFTLAADGETRFATAGSGSRKDAVAVVYGPQTAAAMLGLAPPVGDDGAMSAAGLTSAPSLSRGNRNYITLSVNGRWIRSRRISFAVEQAYHGFLNERRFPVSVIDISAPPGDVDVNVHPSKAEVKFLREQAIFGAVQRAVRAALLEYSPVTEARRFAAPQFGRPAPAVPSPLWPDPLEGSPPAASKAREASSRGARSESADEALTPRRALPVLRLLGQAHETYLIAEGPDGVYLIDQHAAHERVLFEEISERLAENSAESQQLLVPETMELQAEQEEALERLGDEIASLGFVLEPFGPQTVAIRAVPRVLRDGSPVESLTELLDVASEGGDVARWRERLIATLACHGSVTAGRRLADDEARELLRQLEATAQPHSCPHGRPTMIHMSEGSLEREFGRR